MKKLLILAALILPVVCMGWMFTEEKTASVSETYNPPPVATPEPTPEPTPIPTPEPTPTPTPEPTPEPIPEIATDYEVELIARTIWGEAGGIPDPAERAAVAWCILNRVDAWGESIEAVVTAPEQFHGYIDWGVCPDEHIELAEDVVSRWEREKAGQEDVGRVLAADCLWFYGDGQHNYFRNSFRGGSRWDFSSVESPY